MCRTPDRARVVGDQRAQIDRRRLAGMPARQLRVHVAAHLVALAADRRAGVHAEFRGRNAAMRERRDRALDNSRRRSPPAGVEQRDRARRMRDEHGNTVGDGDRESSSAIHREMAVCFDCRAATLPIRDGAR